MGGPYVNINMRSIQNLPLRSGHEPAVGERDKWDVKENHSPSVLDPVWGEVREILTKDKTKTEAKKPLKVELTTVEMVAALTDKCTRLALSKIPIEEHMEERISAFLMQLIDCYDTDLHFTVGHTQDQTESTPSMHFLIQRGVARPPQADLKMTFASAHHGTLPCLFAYPRVEWEAWKGQNNPKAPGKPQAKVYLCQSDTYYLNNACTGLATIINQADIDLDGNPTEKNVEFSRRPRVNDQKKLRELSIALFNRVAKKEINPVQGFGLYMHELTRLVDGLDAQHVDGERHLIFSTWKALLGDLNARYAGNYKLFIATLLGIRIPVGDRDAINLDEIVYPRHFKMMQLKNTYQTELALRVEDLRKKVLAGLPKAPLTFDKAFKAALLKEASQQKEKVRQIFQRYYNANGQTAEQLERECFKPAFDLLDRAASKLKVREFFSEFSKYIHNFTVDQSKFSSGLAKEIRLMRGLSLRTFSQKHNELFPNARRLNYEQLRRIELGCVMPDTGLIGRMARVLDIHESVLKAEFA